MASGNSGLTFEALFDPFSVVPDKSVFKDDALKKIQSEGQQLEISETEDGFIVKAIDPFRSQGYNTFESVDEYQQWLQASLHEPTQDEMEEALNGSRS